MLKVSNFKMVGKPKLINIQFETNEDYKFEDGVSLEINNQVIVRKDEQSHQAKVILNVGVFNSKGIKEVPFKMDMSIEGYFKWDEELQKNTSQLEKLLKQNSPAILYSYLRPIITIITADADLPPLVIPLMNFVE